MIAVVLAYYYILPLLVHRYGMPSLSPNCTVARWMDVRHVSAGWRGAPVGTVTAPESLTH